MSLSRLSSRVVYVADALRAAVVSSAESKQPTSEKQENREGAGAFCTGDWGKASSSSAQGYIFILNAMGSLSKMDDRNLTTRRTK
jgi:hypothetical protein